MRIYEIAKELGISSKEVITFLKSKGTECTSHMAVLSDASLEMVKNKFTSGKNTTDVKPVVDRATEIDSKPLREPVKDSILGHKPVLNKEVTEPLKKEDITHKHSQTITTKTVPTPTPPVSVKDDLGKEVGKHFPKKSDYVAEPVVLEEEVALPEEILTQGKLTRFLGKGLSFEKPRSFRSGGGRRRRQRRQHAAAQELQESRVVTEITVGKELPLFEVANLMGKQSSELILALFKKGMACNRNYILSLDNIRVLCEQFNIIFIVDKSISADDLSFSHSKIISEMKSAQTRWPVVVVMGHVDHGKTTLLDYVRKMHVAASEKGGITQHLGAYEVDSKHGKIIFLDTPGHEAFYHIRERGARITDLVILVIAVDDGIKPQTVEAINHAKSAGVPIIVAINKIDKMESTAALETIKRQLAQHDLMPEDWGGDVVIVPISAKTGKGIDELLEMVVLQSQMMDLKADPSHPARGFVLESKVERGLGSVATVICSDGTLKIGDFFTCGATTGRVKLLVNSFGKRLTQAGPSIPVQVVGFDSYALAGDWLDVVPQQDYLKAKQDKSLITHKSEQPIPQTVLSQLGQKSAKKYINLVIKADTRGSIDAVMGCIQKFAKLSKEVECPVCIVYSGVGDISESDIELAENTNSIIIGFYVRPEKNAAHLAKEKGVELKTFHVIYHFVEDLEKMLESKRKIESVWKQCGEATVKKVFDIKGVGVIAGCYMRDGVLTKGNRVTCMRSGREVGSGKVISLQRDKKTVKEIHSGFECGFTCEGFNEWQEGDTVLCFAEVVQNPTSK